MALAAVGAVLAPAAPAFAAGPPRTEPHADLRADVNRDGRVDITGTSDNTGEDGWTATRGAVFLPNIDDDSKRCATRGPGGKPLSEARLAGCNDATDGVVNGSADDADLARVRSVPMRDLSASASGTLTVRGGAKNTRIFVKRPAGWALVTAGTRLSAAELRAGVEFGVEATDIVRDSSRWGGTAVLRLTVTAGGKSTSDDVTLRAAPLLTHHHLQRAQQLLVTRIPGGDSWAKTQQKFVRELGDASKAAGIAAPPAVLDGYGDIWAQDFVEPGYVSMPAPGGGRQHIRVLLRSAQPGRDAGRELYERLRGRGTGVVQVSGVKDSEEWTLNSMGNLETVPPYRHAGRDFPAGRIIMGERKDNGSKPARAMRTLLASQGAQDPLFLDTSWLHVGHVDEFVQFLPADTPRGWRIGVADPEAGLKLLRDAKAAGSGGVRMFSMPGGKEAPAPRETIAQALASTWLVSDNTMAAEKIAANLEILKRETGVTDAEIVRVPALYTRGTEAEAGGDRADRAPRLTRLGAGLPDAVREHGQQKRALAGRAGGTGKAPATVMTSAYVPGAVNGVLLAPDRYLAPRQWGPVVGGRDLFTDAVTAAYTRAGLKVSYIDDWETYHLGMGEVHCGTNTLRDASQPWWRS
ncbi:protein-arginine deiminase domain-containing protein [Streptomyces sp. LP05-1]|uniref:Protein-arginine deiminase domain-containing protein n=1 Tax=Streptomyces pyxinae TaxID=2970734 RepID=A0ABT2CCC2_9ACTN|nr:protein-arginine deiminase domain-containing protein [Streptomyces sp. LP05-1]MCS0635064.1 protein-arginine deiminase domain-containing protein [Streptomyces sp. LP05-1]